MNKHLRHFLVTLILCPTFLDAKNPCFYNSSFTITTPYQPAFSVRNPRLWALTKSLLAAVGTHWLIKNKKYQYGTVLEGTAALAAWLYKPKETSIHVLDHVLLYPGKLLQSSADICNKITWYGLTNTDIDDILTDTILKDPSNYPLTFLGECECQLGRTNNPHYRAAFEAKVVEALMQKLQRQQHPIHYVSFASGGLFQDLVILTKTLTQCPTAHLIIHIIDPLYERIANLLDTLGKGRDYINFKIDEIRTVPHVIKGRFPHLFLSFLLHEKHRCLQFINFLEKIFPLAKLNLYVHKLADSYVQYIQTHNLPYPDVIAAVDIEDEPQSIPQYENLCIKMMQHNPACSNIWLSNTKKVQLIAICTDGTRRVIHTIA